jgi:hypothetical protein
MTDDELFSDPAEDPQPVHHPDDLLTPQVISRLIDALEGASAGWTHEARVTTRKMMLARWHSRTAAQLAVDQVIISWDGRTRPPWGTLATAYATAIRRLGMERPSAPVNCQGCGGSGWVSWVAESPHSGQPTSYAKACHHPAADQQPDRLVIPQEGRAIALAAYLADCDLQGKVPNQGSIELIQGLGR